MNSSKYICKDNLNKLDLIINKIKNQNIKMDYIKIFNNLNIKFNLLETNLLSPTTTNFDLYLLNYEIEKNIKEVNNKLLW